MRRETLETLKTKVSCSFEPSKFLSLNWSEVEQLKKDLLVAALEICKGNQTHAGDLLGISSICVSKLRVEYHL